MTGAPDTGADVDEGGLRAALPAPDLCKSGRHAMTGDNVVRWGGSGPRCRECARETNRRKKRERAARFRQQVPAAIVPRGRPALATLPPVPPQGHVPDPHWRDKAACTGRADLFLADATVRTVARQKAVCALCPVTKSCLGAGLYEPVGTWGGLTAPERHALAKTLPAPPGP